MVNGKASGGAERLIEQINVTNAKKFALLLIISFATYHGLLHLRYGSNSCKWLLSNGRYKGDQEWQPYGCMLHHYTKIDTRHCLRYLAFYGTDTYFLFIGDIRIRQLYIAFIEHLQQDDYVTKVPDITEQNLMHVNNKLKIKVEFIWSNEVSANMIENFRQFKSAKMRPSVIVAGCGLDTIKRTNATKFSLQEYGKNLTRLVSPIDQLQNSKTTILWMLQEPVNEFKLPMEWKLITNERINALNKETWNILSYSKAYIWESARLVAEGMISESPDGILLAPKSLQHNLQILLNMYCNDHMNFNDGTCCSSTESYTMLQKVTAGILVTCVLITTFITCHRWYSRCRGVQPCPEYALLMDVEDASITQQYQLNDMFTLFKTLTKMTFIMAYFFVCDRTNYFMKENKYYSEFSFWLPIAYVFVLGLFFTEYSRFTKVMHRDQIDELKGWMQLVILVYYVTGASQILPINMHIKVLMSMFLFLLGYEQFCHAWQRGDTGIVAFFRTLFRLNFMTVTLCLCMNRPYQFYYFVPLMSFWYVMIFAVLALPPQVTAQTSDNNRVQYLYLIIKFVGLFSVITILFLSEVFFEKVFVTRPWKALFVTTDDDIHEWWSRWKLDRYSTMSGMIFGFVLLMAQKFNVFDDNNHGNLFTRGIALTTTFLSLVGIGCYVTLTFLCRNELECDEIHSYIVVLPIVSYIVLRNTSGFLRTRYSTFFAWFGSISLELFIGQYHIWLAADTHGVLVLVPGYPLLNLIVTSFIFVCASHEANKLTEILLPYAVPSDWKLVIRNFISFLAILVPIGINDGMF